MKREKKQEESYIDETEIIESENNLIASKKIHRQLKNTNFKRTIRKCNSK